MAHFREHPGVEIRSVELHLVGSKNGLGWCNSLSRRISDCRDALRDDGQTIILSSRTVEKDGQIHTKYKMVPIDDRDAVPVTETQLAQLATA